MKRCCGSLPRTDRFSCPCGSVRIHLEFFVTVHFDFVLDFYRVFVDDNNLAMAVRRSNPRYLSCVSQTQVWTSLDVTPPPWASLSILPLNKRPARGKRLARPVTFRPDDLVDPLFSDKYQSLLLMLRVIARSLSCHIGARAT